MEEEDGMDDLELTDRSQVLSTGIKLMRLQLLDQFSTQYLANDRQLSEQDKPVFRDIALEMDNLLADLTQEVDDVAQLADGHQEWLQRQFEALMEHPELSASLGEFVRSSIEKRGGIARFGENVSRAFLGSVPAARNHLAAQIRALAADSPEADLPDCCENAQAAIFVGIMAGSPVLVIAAAAVGAYCC